MHYLTFGVKVTRNVTQYHLYAATEFEVARSNGLGGDKFIRNVTNDGPTLVRN